MSADAELELGYILVICGGIALSGSAAFRILGRERSGDPGHIADGCGDQSIEARLRLRLPLRKKFSSLPDRAVIGGTAVLLILVPTFLIVLQQDPPAKGIYVRLYPRYTWSRTPDCPQVIIVKLKSERGATQVLLNGKITGSQQLEASLTKELGRRPDWQVFLDADDDVSVADATQVIDAIKSVHADSIILTSKLRREIFRPDCKPE